MDSADKGFAADTDFEPGKDYYMDFADTDSVGRDFAGVGFDTDFVAFLTPSLLACALT